MNGISFLQGGTARAIALGLVLMIGVAGCTTTETSTVTGTLIGAGLGAVIGHQSGHAVEGAVIGALVGGLAGYVVGRVRTDRVASASETNREQQYRAVQGLQVKVTEANVSPAIVAAGGDVDLNATVALMAPEADQRIAVRQRVAIYKGSELVGNILEDNFTMQPGTHRISRRISLQKDFPAGRYTYVTHIKAMSGDDATEVTSESGFSVS